MSKIFFNVLIGRSFIEKKLEELRIRRLVRQVMEEEPHLKTLPVKSK